MFTVERYSEQRKDKWNKFVEHARNATFLFNRGYMDYHSDRFHDYSLLIYKDGKLHSLLPAHKVDDILYSHYGLTYGGLVIGTKVDTADVLELFPVVNSYLRERGFTKVVYRPIPWIYHQMPSEEDLYAIFWKCGARLKTRNIGTTIFLQQHLQWRKDHRRRLKQALEAGVRVERNGDIRDFWPILEVNLLKRFNATPVHSLDEMLLLKSRFPKGIVQYNAWLDNEIIGGITFYITQQVVHGQYSATNDKGKQLGAMEAIYNQIVYNDYPNYLYLDFGSSTEKGNSLVNIGLISHKEGFGGRAICYDTYEWTL